MPEAQGEVSEILSELVEGDEEDFFGLIDLAADAETYSLKLNTSVGRISTSLEHMARNFDQRTKEVNSLKAKGKVSATRLRSIARSAAEAIQDVAGSIDRELPEIRKAWSGINEYFFQILTITEVDSDESIESAKELEKALVELRNSIEGTRDSRTYLATTLRQLGPTSRDIRKATKKARMGLNVYAPERN